MRRVKGLFIIMAIFMLTTLNVWAVDENDGGNIINENDVNRVLENIYDTHQLPVTQASLISENGVKYLLNVYAVNTSMLTKSVSANGQDSITYIASTDDMSLETPMTRGYYGDDTWDSSRSIHFYMTVYFDSTVDGLFDMKRVTKVKGNYTRSQSDLMVKNQAVYAYTSSPYNSVDQVKKIEPTSDSFSFNTGFKKYVPDDGLTATIGASWEATISRGSSWNFYFPIMISQI